MNKYQQLISAQNFKCRDELFNYLRSNKDMLHLAKKSEAKEADGVFSVQHDIDFIHSTAKSIVNKTGLVSQGEGLMPDKFPVSVVINTTKLHDSHDDVHIDGIWKKSVKEKKILYLLKQHEMKFESIISDKINPSLEEMKWSDLGYKYDGTTQALMFGAEVLAERNPFMADQYWKGYVLNHSVGMIYVNFVLALNSESKYDKEEKENWDKYYPLIANKEYTDERGYFWAVLEAKFVEGSAVPLGSNFVTPTFSVGKQEPTPVTPEEPSKDTPSTFFKMSQYINNKLNN